MKKNGLNIVKDNVKHVLDSFKVLPNTDVLVGIPADGAERKSGEHINNAAIGYIAENGAPEANIPARPWLVPGIRSVKTDISNLMREAARAGLEGKGNEKLLRLLNRAGIVAVSAAKKRIQAGIPPPLADSTLRRRAGRKAGKGVRINQGANWELAWRAAGAPAGVDLAKPLIDTGNFYAHISYVIRTRR